MRRKTLCAKLAMACIISRKLIKANRRQSDNHIKLVKLTSFAHNIKSTPGWLNDLGY